MSGSAVPAQTGSSEPDAGTILLIEHNPITRNMLRAALEIEGYNVVEAANGRMALEIASVRRPDLLVLDFVLPDMNGLQLLSEVRANAPDLPAIVVTGMVSRHGELGAGAGGATHFLAKPVQPWRLREVVRAQLASAEQNAGGKAVLVVGDEVNRKIACRWLTRAGYEVSTAGGGEEALEIARRRAPDAILSDVMMPSMDGFTFCREARRDPVLRAVPIVLVSSFYVDAADRELARHMGANALVTRDLQLREAAAALETGLRENAETAAATDDDRVPALHRERLQVQLERQTARNESLLRQAAIQGTALSLLTGLSEVLARPQDVPQKLGDVLVHCLDAAGLSTGLLYMAEPGGDHRLRAQFGIPAERRGDAEAFFGHPELVRRIVEVGQPVAFSSEGTVGDDEARDFLARLGQSSALVLPFTVLGETFGELVLASDSHDLSDPAWIGFARSLALQFGQTVAFGQSLKRLAASEGRHRALMEQANDAIFVLDPGGTILEANLQSATLLGLPRDQVIGRPLSAFSPSAGEHDTAFHFPEGLATGGGRSENVVLRRGDGALVEVDFSMSLSEVDGAASVLAICREVTQRNKAAADLRQAQQMLHHVVSSSPSVLYTLRVEGDTLAPTWVSENIARFIGFTPEEVAQPGWKWEEHLHPDDRDAVLALHPAILSRGRLAQDYRLRQKNGDYLWVHDEQVLVTDGAGGNEVIGSWADVSALKDAELKLRDSEEQHRLLFERNPHPMYVCHAASLAFLAVNDAMVRHYGYSREEFLTLTARDIRHPEDVPALDKARAEAVRDPAPRTGLFKHRTKAGATLEVEVVASLLDFRGRHAWLVLAMDVTEKMGLEERLVRAQKMEAVGQLAGGVAHDFNNLLGVITGYGELLMRDLPPESRARKRVDEILRASDRAAALTRQLLAFGRRQVLQPTVLDLGRVVGEVEGMLQRLISANIQIVTTTTPDLGRVRADEGQIEQVLMNLVLNARDAMPDGGRLVIQTADVDLDEAYARANPEVRPGRHVMLAVTDTGHGMDAKTMSRIFEPFYTTKEEGKGTGLGLATVYGIVHQSGGTVNVYSEPGRGTTFKVYLPRVEGSPAREAPQLPVAPARGTETILLVEDSESLRLLVRELLEEAGYTVLHAEAPDKALALLQSARVSVDLVLTDIVMPRMSGQELARRVGILHPRAAVVFMSGYAEEVAGGEATLALGTLFLQKPFALDALLKVIRRALNGRPRPVAPATV